MIIYFEVGLLEELKGGTRKERRTGPFATFFFLV